MNQVNKNENSQKETLFSWFYEKGQDEDVILSTRVKLVRNLVDFKFPKNLSEDDVRRINSLVEDAFNYDENFYFLKRDEISEYGMKTLKDNLMIKNSDFSAIEINDFQKIFCLVNELNHLKIVKISSGFDCENAMKNIYKIDESLQNKLQFAASYDFGYLTSQIKDCGTGLKISLRIFIPSIIISGKFKNFLETIEKNDFILKPILEKSQNDDFFQNNGDFSNFFFDLIPQICQKGTELEQLAQIQSLGIYILKTERKIRTELADNNPTLVLNLVKSNFAKILNSLFLTYEDALSAIGIAKLGLEMNLLTGISEKDLNILLYSTKIVRLLILKNELLESDCENLFEEDIKDNEILVLQRLRAIVIQEAFKNIKFI